MTSVDVILDHYLWKKKIKNPKIYIKKKIEKLSKLNLFKKKPKNHTIFLTNNRKMKALNKKFRNKNKFNYESYKTVDSYENSFLSNPTSLRLWSSFFVIIKIYIIFLFIKFSIKFFFSIFLCIIYNIFFLSFQRYFNINFVPRFLI